MTVCKPCAAVPEHRCVAGEPARARGIDQGRRDGRHWPNRATLMGHARCCRAGGEQSMRASQAGQDDMFGGSAAGTAQLVLPEWRRIRLAASARCWARPVGHPMDNYESTCSGGVLAPCGPSSERTAAGRGVAIRWWPAGDRCRMIATSSASATAAPVSCSMTARHASEVTLSRAGEPVPRPVVRTPSSCWRQPAFR